MGDSLLWTLISWPSAGGSNSYDLIRVEYLEDQLRKFDNKEERERLNALATFRLQVQERTNFRVERFGLYSKLKAITHIKEVGETIGCDYILITKAGSINPKNRFSGYEIEGKFYSHK